MYKLKKKCALVVVSVHSFLGFYSTIIYYV